MGMQFSPMYQPVSTKTIKADGDLNVSPYDVIAYDGKFDTVEADEFVGGVGNFSSGLVSGDLEVNDLKVNNITISGNTSLNSLSLPLKNSGLIQVVSISEGRNLSGGNGLYTSPTYGAINQNGSIKYSGEYTVTMTCVAAGLPRTVNFYRNGALDNTQSFNNGNSKNYSVGVNDSVYFTIENGSGYFQFSISGSAYI